MNHPILLATAMVLAMTLPGLAQDSTTFTPTDETILQQCIETVRDINAEAAPGEEQEAATCIGQAANACQSDPGGSSTIGITQCNQREASWWDGYLNDSYADLQANLDPTAFASLKKAQRAWIAFRDADCSFQYARWGDGSMRNIAHSSCMLQQTAQRALSLSALLQEGY